jgi:ATP-dependent helicase HrpB
VGVRAGSATLAARFTGKRRGKLDERSAVANATTFVSAEMTEVEGKEISVHLRKLTSIENQCLAEVFPDQVKTLDRAVWDERRRAVVARMERCFRDLVLEASESDRDVNLDAAATLLAERVLAGELRLKRWDDAVEQWCARLACLSSWMPELELPGWSDEDREAAVAQICHGATRYKEIKEAEVWPVLKEWLSAPQRAALDAYAPTRLRLAGGRESKVRYAIDGPPVIGVMVRDLFGQWATPAVADGRVPVVVEVQAPNRRPWQVTRDLESFWRTGYAQMRKDLAGRYPKHPWPEDPRAANG